MDRRLVLAALRAAMAALTLVAIVVQASSLAAIGRFDPVNFFSYFTIQSNLIGAGVFLVGAARWRATPSRGWDLLRGAAVLYLTVTFVVFALLLSGIDVDTAIPWVNSVVHGVFPLAVIADWLIDPPASRVEPRRALRWLAYPVAWLGYTLVRGPIVGWYPYPFLDPANGGYGTVGLYVVGIFAFGLLLVAVIAGIGNGLRGRRLVPAPQAAAA